MWSRQGVVLGVLALLTALSACGDSEDGDGGDGGSSGSAGATGTGGSSAGAVNGGAAGRSNGGVSGSGAGRGGAGMGGTAGSSAGDGGAGDGGAGDGGDAGDAGDGMGGAAMAGMSGAGIGGAAGAGAGMGGAGMGGAGAGMGGAGMGGAGMGGAGMGGAGMGGAGAGMGGAGMGGAGMAGSGGVPAINLFFSEYYEGTATPQESAVEIYNAGIAAANLTQCSLRVYQNGMGNFTAINLITTLAPGQVYVVCSAQTVSGSCDQSNSTMGQVTGNDAVAIVCSGAFQDIIGQIGFDPANGEWGTGNASTADNTIRRSCTVTTGDRNGTDTFTLPATQWSGFTATKTDLGTRICIN